MTNVIIPRLRRRFRPGGEARARREEGRGEQAGQVLPVLRLRGRLLDDQVLRAGSISRRMDGN